MSADPAVLHDPLLAGDRHPYVRRIKTADVRPAARQAVWPLIDALAGKPETEGVVALSGLAERPGRHFLDVHSDIDIALFISIPAARTHRSAREFVRRHADALPRWLPAFSFFLPVADRLMEVNCRQLIVQIEERTDTVWSPAKQEAYGYSGEVLYDRTGRVMALLRNKCRPPSTERLVWLACRLPWDGWLNVTAQIRRGLHLNARFLLNRAVDELLELLVLAEGRHPPADKWRAEAALDCSHAPPDLARSLRQILSCVCEEEPLLAAVDEFRHLCTPILDRLTREGLLPPDAYRYVSIHLDEDKQLLQRVGGDDLVERRGQELDDRERAVLFGLANLRLLEPGQDFAWGGQIVARDDASRARPGQPR
jgi:hypothetical protein